MTSYVVAGIPRNFTATLVVSGALTTTIRTHFGGYLHVRAGPGKLVGTGVGVTTGTQAVLL